MIKILFVCHGNICRSAMAEAMMKDLVRREGTQHLFRIDSAATSREEIGNRMYPPAQRKLTQKGVPVGEHRARQMTRQDYEDFDLLIGMDEENMYYMNRIAGGDPDGKIHRLLEYAGISREIADPWYTDDFESTYRDLETGLSALYQSVMKHGLA